MKIAYIYDAVYPWVKGGAEKRIYEIGRRLADKGHEALVKIVNLEMEGITRRIEKKGLEM